MEINLHGVTVQNCQTEYGDFVIDFYPSDHKRYKVKQHIPDHYTIVHTEHAEEGELVIWFIEFKHNK